jgi:hypothetical protein
VFSSSSFHSHEGNLVLLKYLQLLAQIWGRICSWDWEEEDVQYLNVQPSASSMLFLLDHSPVIMDLGCVQRTQELFGWLSLLCTTAFQVQTSSFAPALMTPLLKCGTLLDARRSVL